MIGLLGLLHIDEFWFKQKLLHIDEVWFKQKLPHIEEIRLKEATDFEDKYLENFFAPSFFFFFSEFSSDFVFNSDIMDKGGNFA